MARKRVLVDDDRSKRKMDEGKSFEDCCREKMGGRGMEERGDSDECDCVGRK